ncbi:ribosomal maturation YjgA family protein [Anaerosporobacter sp.]
MHNEAINTINKKRLLYLISFIVLMIIEIVIALYIHDTLIRPYIGDVLVIGLLYTFIRIFIPEHIHRLPYLLFGFSTIIEILQYFNFASLLDCVNSEVLRIVLGSTFDLKDILCYAFGTMIIVIIQHLIKTK